MYQSYPSSGDIVDPTRPAVPASVANAVKLMYVGAAVATVSLIVTLVSISGTKAAIRKARPSLTTAQVNQLNHFIIVVAIIYSLVGIALWLWMARANGQGKNWARILASVLFILATVDLTGVISQPKTLLSVVFPVLSWFVGLAAVVLLWRAPSTAFFRPQQQIT